MYDLVIIGAGVTGYSAAMYSARLELDVAVIGDLEGGTITLTDDVSNYPGFNQLTGKELAENLKAHALDYVEQSGDRLEALAATIGAVNTLKIGFGALISGFNTDYAGAMDALLAAMGIGKHGLHNVKAAVLGAGGVARAIVAGLTDVGAKVLVYNRTVAKAKSLAEEFKCGYASIKDAAAMDAGVVINCTSIGMHPKVDASPAPAESIKSDMVVFDTVYNPLDTLLLRYVAIPAKLVNDGDVPFFGLNKLVPYYIEIVNLAREIGLAIEKQESIALAIETFVKTRLVAMKSELGEPVKPVSTERQRAYSLGDDTMGLPFMENMT